MSARPMVVAALVLAAAGIGFAALPWLLPAHTTDRVPSLEAVHPPIAPSSSSASAGGGRTGYSMFTGSIAPRSQALAAGQKPAADKAWPSFAAPPAGLYTLPKSQD
ncbi:MAG: hypothetical protein ACOH2J_07010 [Allorhizobium sp.]